jgi:hypothetical protein
MGVTPWRMVSYGALQTFHVPAWVMISCARHGAGYGVGGWRIIKTVGWDFVKLQRCPAFAWKPHPPGSSRRIGHRHAHQQTHVITIHHPGSRTVENASPQ